MLTRFLFWNVQGKPLRLLVSMLASDLAVDVVVLAECDSDEAALVVGTSTSAGFQYRSRTPLGRDLRVYSRLPPKFVRPFSSDSNGHFAVYRIVRPGHAEVLLATVHYQSRRHWESADQDLHAPAIADEVRRQEARAGHKRTIVVGDFNMNPFDRGMVAAPAFHAVMTRDLARDRARVVDARPYDMFYNPMWRLFGDHTPGPAGTHWYRPAKPLVYGCNMYDQVLLRPDLMDGLVDLKIVDRIGQTSLLRNGRPDATVGSDHLPVFFSIDL